MDAYLNEIIRKHIKITKQERSHNRQIVDATVKETLKIMRDKDSLFNSMNPSIAYLGSYYDGLRVGHATEFDINIVLKLPINYKNIVLNASKMEAYTFVVMPSEFRRLSKIPITATNGFTETKFWCDRQHRLSVQKFRSWMQSVLDKALSSLPKRGEKYLIQVNNKMFPILAKLSGPANTISIYDNDNIIDIDLVPTFTFNLNLNKPINCKVDFTKNVFHKIKKYYIVPKPTDDEYIWRLAFPSQEKAIMSKKNNFKKCCEVDEAFKGYSRI
ncbi:cyclic GMP-AMP synthase-like receptor isoform X1 [Achroia grisella]|uniref:cyclic GMP-AMP synthase-like receptor isoform X1 n=1 Tax=Achroia grisella TaxID=688607 RepID=UPI0027D1FE12|nr:cyclic GMP-AMP synthase-like receptor isoform X1 [Achroia grisella]